MPKRHKLYPEPGAWVVDNYKGLPKMEPPNIPKIENLSRKQVADLVEYEGLGFCIYSLISSERITDEVLAEKWRTARRALMAVVRHLDREPIRKKRPHKKTKKINLGREL